MITKGLLYWTGMSKGLGEKGTKGGKLPVEWNIGSQIEYKRGDVFFHRDIGKRRVGV